VRNAQWEREACQVRVRSRLQAGAECGMRGLGCMRCTARDVGRGAEREYLEMMAAMGGRQTLLRHPVFAGAAARAVLLLDRACFAHVLLERRLLRTSRWHREGGVKSGRITVTRRRAQMSIVGLGAPRLPGRMMMPRWTRDRHAAAMNAVRIATRRIKRGPRRDLGREDDICIAPCAASRACVARVSD